MAATTIPAGQQPVVAEGFGAKLRGASPTRW